MHFYPMECFKKYAAIYIGKGYLSVLARRFILNFKGILEWQILLKTLEYRAPSITCGSINVWNVNCKKIHFHITVHVGIIQENHKFVSRKIICKQATKFSNFLS